MKRNRRIKYKLNKDCRVVPSQKADDFSPKIINNRHHIHEIKSLQVLLPIIITDERKLRDH